MAEIKNVDLKELHDAINARLTEAFPGVSIFTNYERFQKLVPTPAILVELVEMPRNQDDGDTGTGQFHFDLNFEARCVCKNIDGAGTVAVRKLAIALAGYIHDTKWGMKVPDDPNQTELEIQPVSPAYVNGAFEDVWEPDIDTYEAFRVEWSHSAYVGVDAFLGGDFVPVTLNIIEKVESRPFAHLLLQDNGDFLLEDGVGRLLLDGRH